MYVFNLDDEKVPVKVGNLSETQLTIKMFVVLGIYNCGMRIANTACQDS